MPPARQGIIAGYNDLAERMERTASGLSEQDLGKTVCLGWNTKDVLCHLAASSRAAPFFIAMAQTGSPGPGADFDVDAWNAAQVAERHEKPLSDLLAEFRAGNDASINAVESVSEDLLAKQVPNFDEGGTWALAEQLCGLSGHGVDHLNDIEKAFKG